MANRAKVRGRTGCQLVLPLPHVCEKHRGTLESAHAEPHGEKVARMSDERYKLLVEVDMLAREHPAFHSEPIYYNV